MTGRTALAIALIAAGLAVVSVLFAQTTHLSRPLGVSPAQAATVTVRLGDVWFCASAGPPACAQPHDTTIAIGDTVTWEWGPGGSGTALPHTTTHCADSFVTCGGPREWDSVAFTSAGTFSHTLGLEDEGLTFLYRCQVHPLDMQGRIIVQFSGDNDSDGLSNAAEAAAGTNANNPDTDGEGLNDGQEVNVHGTNPLVADTDGDNFNDLKEVQIGTRPTQECPTTTASNDELVDAWPPDFDDNRSVNISDVLALKPAFNTSVPPTSSRFDIAVSGAVNITDVLTLKPVFNTICTP